MAKVLTQKWAVFLWALALLCGGCGYRPGHGSFLSSYKTICIPYVEGDDQGVLTTFLIRSFEKQGRLCYRSRGAQLALRVCLFAPEEKTIGFAYAPKDERDVENVIVSNEARTFLKARVTVIDCVTGTCVLGPFEVGTWIDFDYEPDLGNVDAHAFSLGQLEMFDLAEDAALRPLYQLLAQKIVDYVVNSW